MDVDANEGRSVKVLLVRVSFLHVSTIIVMGAHSRHDSDAMSEDSRSLPFPALRGKLLGIEVEKENRDGKDANERERERKKGRLQGQGWKSGSRRFLNLQKRRQRVTRAVKSRPKM